MRSIDSLYQSHSHICIQPRKPQTCARCHRIKYVSGIGGEANHKKLHCDDGARARDVTDPPPDWPQPAGVFSAGTFFHPLIFLKTIWQYHNELQEHGEDGLSMEMRAFMKMVDRRKLEVQSSQTGKATFLFQLFPYLTSSPPLPELVEEHNGLRYLRVDCLSGPPGGVEGGDLTGGCNMEP